MVADLVRPIITILAYLSHMVAYLFNPLCCLLYPCPWLWSHSSIASGSWFSQSSLTMANQGSLVHHDFERTQWFRHGFARRAMVSQSHYHGFVRAMVSHWCVAFWKIRAMGLMDFFNLGEDPFLANMQLFGLSKARILDLSCLYFTKEVKTRELWKFYYYWRNGETKFKRN